MGSAASALLDVASELNLNVEQRKRYRGLYLELAKTGKTPHQILGILSERIAEEREKGHDVEKTITHTRRHSLTKSTPQLHPPPTTATPQKVPAVAVTPVEVSAITPTEGVVPYAESNDVNPALSPSPGKEPGSTARSNCVSRESSIPHSASAPILSAPSAASSPVRKAKIAATAVPTETLTKDVEEPENLLDHLLDGIDENSRNIECRLCKVRFELPTQLRRHLSFSQLHSGNATDYVAARTKRIRELLLENHIRQSIGYMASRASQVRNYQKTQPTVSALRWFRAIRIVALQLRVTKMCSLLLQVYKLSPPEVPMNPMYVLFSGTKLFWRTQENIEVYIYHHDDAFARNITSTHDSVIQISGYNSLIKQHVETLYVNYRALVALLERQARTIADATNENTSSGGASGLPKSSELSAVTSHTATSTATATTAPTTIVRRKSMDSLPSGNVVEISYATIVEYLLSRLELTTAAGNVGKSKLVLAASAAAANIDTTSMSSIVSRLLGFGVPIMQSEANRPTSATANNSMMGTILTSSLESVVPTKVQTIIRNISNSRSSNLSQNARMDVAESIAWMHAETSQLAQAKRIMALQVSPVEAYRLRSVELPKWELAALTQPPKGHVNMKIADLHRQTRQLKELSKRADHYSVKVTQNLEDYAVVAANAHLPPRDHKLKPHKKGGLTMETVASQQRNRRKSIG